MAHQNTQWNSEQSVRAESRFHAAQNLPPIVFTRNIYITSREQHYLVCASKVYDELQMIKSWSFRVCLNVADDAGQRDTL